MNSHAKIAIGCAVAATIAAMLAIFSFATGSYVWGVIDATLVVINTALAMVNWSRR